MCRQLGDLRRRLPAREGRTNQDPPTQNLHRARRRAVSARAGAPHRGGPRRPMDADAADISTSPFYSSWKPSRTRTRERPPISRPLGGSQAGKSASLGNQTRRRAKPVSGQLIARNRFSRVSARLELERRSIKATARRFEAPPPPSCWTPTSPPPRRVRTQARASMRAHPAHAKASRRATRWRGRRRRRLCSRQPYAAPRCRRRREP